MSDPNQDTQLVALVAAAHDLGEQVRELKAAAANSDSAVLDAAVAKLLAAKEAVNARRVELGLPVASTGARRPKSERAKVANATASASASSEKKADKTDGPVKKASLLGLTVKKSENFSDWYSQVVTKTELIEYYDISGCYILRPDAYEIWEHIKTFFDGEIKKLGVRNCYFPMFISKAALCKEEDHVEGFAPEVAWVTKGGKSDLEEPIAVRPTSETAMYPAYAKWIRGHRDLPLKLNQWVSVVRWEFKSPTPFLRSREFLWQEGHTAFSSREEAMEEVYQILDLYKQVYEDVLAVPVIKGHKTEEEKFPGGEVTTTVECYISQSGRAIQAATSHCLGQNFAKMYDVIFENDKGERQHAWQNSWGLTTRSIGIMIMTHGDDKGLVLPSRVAATQVVILPLEFKDVDPAGVHAKASAIEKALLAKGIRVLVDRRQGVNPGFKHNHWELRGVPVRVEVGPRDVENNTCVLVRRDTFEKVTVSTSSLGEFADRCEKELDELQLRLLVAARAKRDAAIAKITEWKDFVPSLNSKKICLVPWCEVKECEHAIKAQSGEEAKDVVETMDKATQAANDSGQEKFVQLSGAAKSLCMPLEQPDMPSGTKCIKCGKDAKKWCLFGRSY